MAALCASIRAGNRYCVADFYWIIDDGPPWDYWPMQPVGR